MTGIDVSRLTGLTDPNCSSMCTGYPLYHGIMINPTVMCSNSVI